MTPLAPNRRRRRDARSGFSLVELLVVIGIIALLVTISLFVINKARRTASMARIKSDFVAISTAIDQFKADHKALPGMAPNLPPNVHQHNALAYCLVSPQPASGGGAPDPIGDGADGPGFRVQLGAPTTKLWPSYLDASKFKAVQRPTLPDGTALKRGSHGWELLDAYDMPIVYLPKRKTAVRPNMGLVREYPTSSNVGAYDSLDVKDYLDVLKTGDARRGLLMALGDANCNGVIDPGETPNFQGDYVLMSAGPDATFFTIAGNSPTAEETKAFVKADDVYNFDR